MMTIEQFVGILQAAAFEHRMHGAKHLALDAIGQMIETEAKRVIGTYTFNWPQLQAATQREREREGFEPNAPLLRTGELRDSISHQVVSDDEVEIGSDSKVALFQEFGTSTIPPRPFLMPSAIYLLEGGAIQEVISEIIGSALAGEYLDHATLHLIVDALKDLGEAAKTATMIDQAEEDH
jgi:phage gpG-like protein